MSVFRERHDVECSPLLPLRGVRLDCREYASAMLEPVRSFILM